MQVLGAAEGECVAKLFSVFGLVILVTKVITRC